MECHPIKKKEIETETRGMKVESGFNIVLCKTLE